MSDKSVGSVDDNGENAKDSSSEKNKDSEDDDPEEKADEITDLLQPMDFAPLEVVKKKSEHVTNLELKIRRSIGKKKVTNAGTVLVE